MLKTVLTTLMLFLSGIFLFAQTLSKEALCKKWYLDHYEYLWIDYEVEENEINDYIHFFENMTYESVDEGEFSTGKWYFNSKSSFILMYDQSGESIKLLVEKLTENTFVFEIKHEELEGIDIYYSTKK